MLNSFTKDEICENKDELGEYKIFYKEKMQSDKKVLEKVNSLMEKDTQKSNEYLGNILNKLQDNLNLYEKSILDIDENIDLLEDIERQLKENNNNEISYNFQDLNDELQNNIDRYNDQYVNIRINYKENLLNNENIVLDCIEIQAQEIEKDTKILPKNVTEEQDNNVLLISEIQNKVILPYKTEELNEILKNNVNEYQNIQDIIDKKYTIPLVNYEYSSVSRFREAFILMKEKEQSSFMDAIDLSFELMWKRYLHPAIITACKNLDQLDVYLDCLDTNELDEFPFFKIKYELYPVKVKKKEFEYSDITSKKNILGFFRKSSLKKSQKE